MMPPATAAHAKSTLGSCMGGIGSQRGASSPPSTNAEHDNMKLTLLQPPRTAKRPSLITHPLQPQRCIRDQRRTCCRRGRQSGRRSSHIRCSPEEHRPSWAAPSTPMAQRALPGRAGHTSPPSNCTQDHATRTDNAPIFQPCRRRTAPWTEHVRLPRACAGGKIHKMHLTPCLPSSEHEHLSRRTVGLVHGNQRQIRHPTA